MASESNSILDKVLDYLTEHFGPNLPSNEDAIKKLKKERFKPTPATPESNKKLFPGGIPPSRKPKSKPKPRPRTRSNTVEAKKGGLFTRKGAMKRNKS